MPSPLLRTFSSCLCAVLFVFASARPSGAQEPASERPAAPAAQPGAPPEPPAQPSDPPAGPHAAQTGDDAGGAHEGEGMGGAKPGKKPGKKGGKKGKAADAEAAAELGASELTAAPAGVTASAGGLVFELKGRVFAAGVYDDDQLEDLGGTPATAEALSLSVPSARIGLRVDMLDLVSLVLEAEVAGNVRLRDGFVQARKKRWLVRAGQFKMPISSFHLESPWTLPVARRGWLHELLSDHMLLTGRREGFVGRLEGGGFFDPALTVGAFRSVQWGPDAGDPVEGLAIGDQTLVARLATTPGGVELAAVGQRRVTQQPTGLEGYWAGGADATGDLEFERTGLRFWAEALAGTSWYETDPTRAGDATFVEGRLLVAWRWGGVKRNQPYIEGFATAGVLEPDTAVVDDLFFEVMAGANVGHWRSTRLTLQFEYDKASRNFPRSMFFDFGQRFLADHKAVVLQAGAAF
jgi:hypothetical protein